MNKLELNRLRGNRNTKRYRDKINNLSPNEVLIFDESSKCDHYFVHNPKNKKQIICAYCGSKKK